MAKRERVHVLTVRWRFTQPLSRAEARRAVADLLPEHIAPERALFIRDDDIEECDVTARLATKKEADNAR